MKNIKNMLLGIAIILTAIAFHLFVLDKFITDMLALVGIGVVLLGYCTREEH